MKKHESNLQGEVRGRTEPWVDLQVLTKHIGLFVFVVALLAQIGFAQEAIPAQEVRAIAQEAYIYAYPMVDHYRILYAYHVDPQSP